MLRNYTKIIALVFVFIFSFSAVSFAEKELTGTQIKKKLIEETFANRELDPIEGFWTYASYEIAIYKTFKKDTQQVIYRGIIINDKKVNGFKPGEAKLWFEKTAVDHIFTGGWHWRYTTGLVYSKHWYYATFDMRSPNIINVDHSNGSSSNSLIRREQVGQSQTRAVGSGTGFFITQRHIATNEHVVKGGKAFDITLASGQTLSATLVASDPANDLAILQIDSMVSISPLRMGQTRDVKAGERVFTIGHPLGSSLSESSKVSEGIVNNLTGIANDIRKFQISVPITHGNSGGPLFNSKGEVVGITSSGLNSSVAQNINFAIKADYLYLLANNIPGAELAFGSGQRELNAVQVMELYGQAIVRVTTKK